MNASVSMPVEGIFMSDKNIVELNYFGFHAHAKRGGTNVHFTISRSGAEVVTDFFQNITLNQAIYELVSFIEDLSRV